MRARVVVGLLLFIGAPLAAQVTAKQGLPDPKQFASPMILEIPLREPGTLAMVGSTRYLRDTQGYFCEDATITRLVLTRTVGSSRDASGAKFVRLTVEGDVYVRPSYDRYVTLAFALVSSDSEVASMTTKRFEAEEKKTRFFKVYKDLSPAQFAHLTSGDSKALIRVTVTVESDR